MSNALIPVFEPAIIDLIYEFMHDDEPEIEWETVYGVPTIYQSRHILTYGGGPEGGYVYFYKEREPGWYKWSRTWSQEPKYEKIAHGKIVNKYSPDEDEKIALVPESWTPPEDDEETTYVVMDDDVMQQVNE